MSEATGCSVPQEFLPFELDYIPEFLKESAQTELFEDENTRIQGLNQLRSLLKDEPDLKWQDEDYFLLGFLRARKFDVKRAFHLVKSFYNVMRKRSELYQEFNFEDVRRAIEENDVGFLPYRDSEGCAIFVVRTSRWDPERLCLGGVMRALTSGLIHANLSPATQIAGFKVIFDFDGFTMRHLMYMQPTYLWLFAEAVQNCFPGRFKAIHVVNEGHFFSYIWVVIKQFLTKKMRDRYHFHGKNVKKLHKYFSPSILTAEYEGELPPYDNTEWVNMMKEKSDYIAKVYSYGYRKSESNAQEKNSKNS